MVFVFRPFPIKTLSWKGLKIWRETYGVNLEGIQGHTKRLSVIWLTHHWPKYFLQEIPK
jgi:hypothetical protein